MAEFSQTERAIAENIRRFREARGWRQQELADEMTGWSSSTVSKVENPDAPQNRHLSADEVVALARVFGVTVEELARPSAEDIAAYSAAENAEKRAGEVKAAVVALLDAIHALQDAHIAWARTEEFPVEEMLESAAYGRALRIINPTIVTITNDFTNRFIELLDGEVVDRLDDHGEDDGVAWSVTTTLAGWLWNHVDRSDVIGYWRNTGIVTIDGLTLEDLD